MTDRITPTTRPTETLTHTGYAWDAPWSVKLETYDVKHGAVRVTILPPSEDDETPAVIESTGYERHGLAHALRVTADMLDLVVGTLDLET